MFKNHVKIPLLRSSSPQRLGIMAHFLCGFQIWHNSVQKDEVRDQKGESWNIIILQLVPGHWESQLSRTKLFHKPGMKSAIFLPGIKINSWRAKAF